MLLKPPIQWAELIILYLKVISGAPCSKHSSSPYLHICFNHCGSFIFTPIKINMLEYYQLDKRMRKKIALVWGISTFIHEGLKEVRRMMFCIGGLAGSTVDYYYIFTNMFDILKEKWRPVMISEQDVKQMCTKEAWNPNASVSCHDCGPSVFPSFHWETDEEVHSDA